MKKILILFVAFFACVGCLDYNSLSQDMIVTDVEYGNIEQGKCLYTVRFFNRDTHKYTSSMSFYGKIGAYSHGDTLTLVKLNKK
jgi:hypothetical protein